MAFARDCTHRNAPQKRLYFRFVKVEKMAVPSSLGEFFNQVQKHSKQTLPKEDAGFGHGVLVSSSGGTVLVMCRVITQVIYRGRRHPHSWEISPDGKQAMSLRIPPLEKYF